MSAGGFFVTGTDTEIGKTLVSCILIRELVAAGKKVIGMKPVASGAQEIDGSLRNEDAMALIDSANVDADYEQVNPYCFVPPVAPHLAAEQAGVAIDIHTIITNFTALTTIADVVVVEGVGGWRVPLGSSFAVSDLAHRLGLPVIMVVGIRLGCINHAMLTAESIQANGCKLAGWVANVVDRDGLMTAENIATLQGQLPVPMLASIPFLPPGQDTDLCNVFNIKTLEKHLDI